MERSAMMSMISLVLSAVRRSIDVKEASIPNAVTEPAIAAGDAGVTAAALPRLDMAIPPATNVAAVRELGPADHGRLRGS